MKRLDRKSDCAINYALENIGDPWSLLIVRDIIYFGKRTFGEFLASDERIGTSVLARRLASLETAGILTRKQMDSDKRREVYSLSAKGLDLIPLVLEMAEWGATHDSNTGASRSWIESVRNNRGVIFDLIRSVAADGNAIFDGAGNVSNRISNYLEHGHDVRRTKNKST